jgi:hypothetical protein
MVLLLLRLLREAHALLLLRLHGVLSIAARARRARAVPVAHLQTPAPTHA